MIASLDLAADGMGPVCIAGSLIKVSRCAWIVQAEPGKMLICNRGFLTVDVPNVLSKLHAVCQRTLLHVVAATHSTYQAKRRRVSI